MQTKSLRSVLDAIFLNREIDSLRSPSGGERRCMIVIDGHHYFDEDRRVP